MGSREEILADFQACTGIVDVGAAIEQLDDANWILLDAVNKAMPASPEVPNPSLIGGLGAEASGIIDVDSLPGTPSTSRRSNGPPPPPIPLRSDSNSGSGFGLASSESSSSLGVFASGGGLSVADDFYRGAGPSMASTRTRMLDFYVQHNDKTFQLKVPDNEDVKTLKTLIQGETKCPPCQQTLTGLNGNSALLLSENRRLCDLNLPKENFLHLIIPEEFMDTSESRAESSDDYKIQIHCIPQAKTYNLNFRPTHTVLNVKLDVASLTSIPVSKQAWTGWPENINDDLSLAQIGIPQEHKLTLNQIAGAPDMPTLEASTSGERRSVGNQSAHAESEDDFEDASEDPIQLDDDDDDDDIFEQNSFLAASKRLQPLIPDDYGDVIMASLKFGEEFANRYGSPHPGFFPGTLDDAVKDACMQPPKQRKMLAIYLHHDKSVLTNVFCTQALCADSVVSFLNENFVTFGWDLTFSSNKKRALDMITNHFGSVTAATVRNLDIERLPLLALVYRLRGTTEIFQIIHGNVNVDELMSQLLQAHDTYAAQLSVEIREDEERQAREAVKQEQDLAFEMAQHADREKELVRQREEEERLEQERLQEAIRQSEEEARLKEEAQKERVRVEVAKSLPVEPLKDTRHAKIRFRVPGEQSNLERRFLATDSLELLFNFLTSKGFSPDDFKVLSSWPRRDLTTLERASTMEELKLYPQETLTLEER